MNNVSAMIKSINFRTRNDDSIEGRITISGVRKSFYGATKTEIKQKVKEYLLKIENGYREPKNIVLNDYIEYWLKTYKLNKIEPTSYSRLYVVWNNQIKNTIGMLKIGKISTKDIQRLIDEHANPTGEDTRALALSGLKKIVQFLNPCFNMAVKEGIISKNSCEDVILPKESCIITKTKKQISLTDDEIEELKSAALEKYKNGKYKSRDAIVLLLIINLGLRFGEILALEWNAIDDVKLVYIEKIVQSNIKNFDRKTPDEKAILTCIKKSSKTHSGERILKLNEMTLSYIEILKQYDKENGICSDFVACTNAGIRNTTRNLQRSLDRLIKRNNIRSNVSLHTLRHTFGSTLLRRGVNIEVVSKLMGHSNITITYNRYIHTIKEEEARAMTMVNVC